MMVCYSYNVVNGDFKVSCGDFESLKYMMILNNELLYFSGSSGIF